MRAQDSSRVSRVRLIPPILACLALSACLARKIDSVVDANGIEWVSIPGGSFVMQDSSRDHLVAVKSFRLARTAVTNGQYRECVRAGACAPPRDYGASFDGPSQPVVGVTWFQAEAFARWAGGRLPSEAEWVFAAYDRGRRKSSWLKPTCDFAVIYEKGKGNGCGRDATWPVCSKPRGNTAQGLCDMSGNALQWLEDAEVDEHSLAPADGSARKGPSENRLTRGTAWDDTEFYGLPTDHYEASRADEPSDYVGFRLAR
jgi:formylglycine-generating enzyme required for sulfatase activity